jgi:hypothetical protein
VEKKLSSWYRNPVMWVSVGFILGVAIETTVIIVSAK